MTSTTSSKNSFKQGLSVFLWTLRSSKATIIVYLSLLTFSCISNFILNAGVNGLAVTVGSSLTLIPLLSQVVCTEILALVFAFILSIQGFGYLHNKRKTDMFGSLPVTRRTLFFSKMISTIVISVVPMLIVLFSLNIIYANADVSDVFSIETTISALVCVIANVAFFGLMSVCCGKTSDTIVSTVVINCAYPVLMFMFQILPASFLYGYVPNFNVYLTFALSPIFGVSSYIYWIVFSAICIAGSFFLIKHRKAESAQSHFAFKLPFIAVKLILSLACGIVFAYLFSLLLGSGATILESYLSFWLGMILGSFVAYVVIHIILAHGVKGFLKGLIPYGAMLVVFAGVFLVLDNGMFGFESYVPKAEDVKSVNFDSVNTVVDNGKTIADYNSEDKEFIAQVINAHQKVVDYTAEKKLSIYDMSATNLRTLFSKWLHTDFFYRDEEDYYYDYYETFGATYVLNDGSVVTRDYGELVNDEYTLRKELDSFFYSNEYLENTNDLFVVDDKYCAAINVTYYSDDSDDSDDDIDDFILYSRKSADNKFISELLPALRKDLLNDEAENSSSEDDDSNLYDISLYYSEDPSKVNSDNYYEVKLENGVAVKKSYKNTLKVIEKYSDDINYGKFYTY
jgi:ABC-2 type transport system permease protein